MRPHADQGDRPRARVVRRACRRTRAIAAGKLAERDGITLAMSGASSTSPFWVPSWVEAGSCKGRQPVELTATRLTELDLPLDWTDQRRLLAN